MDSRYQAANKLLQLFVSTVSEKKELNITAACGAIDALYKLRRERVIIQADMARDVTVAYQNVLLAAEQGVPQARDVLKLLVQRQRNGNFQGTDKQQDLVTAFLNIPSIKEKCLADCERFEFEAAVGDEKSQDPIGQREHAAAMQVLSDMRSSELSKSTAMMKLKFAAQKGVASAGYDYCFHAVYKVPVGTSLAVAYDLLCQDNSKQAVRVMSYMVLKKLSMNGSFKYTAAERIANRLLEKREINDKFRAQYLTAEQMCDLSQRMTQSFDVESDRNNYLLLLGVAAERGYELAQVALATAYLNPEDGFPLDETRALELLRAIRNKGTRIAQFNVNSILLAGRTFRLKLRNSIAEGHFKELHAKLKEVKETKMSQDAKSSASVEPTDDFAVAINYFLNPLEQNKPVVEAFLADESRYFFPFFASD